jgi:hypothetical protein
MEGDPKDYLLAAGEQVHFTGAGLLVVEGLAKENEAELSI